MGYSTDVTLVYGFNIPFIRLVRAERVWKQIGGQLKALDDVISTSRSEKLVPSQASALASFPAELVMKIREQMLAVTFLEHPFEQICKRCIEQAPSGEQKHGEECNSALWEQVHLVGPDHRAGCIETFHLLDKAKILV